jgi:hypothetical protein
MRTTDKVRANRLRRMAARYGLRLVKSGRRDPRAPDYGLYALIDNRIGGAVNPACPEGHQFLCSWSLADVERYLTA